MLIGVALAALAADILSKTIVVATLHDKEPIRLLGGLLTLRETRNSGAAFSIGTGYTIVFTVIACGVVAAILRTARNLRSLPWAVCLGLLLGGAIGNLIDRMFRAPAPLEGHVVDWIQLPRYPVFNLADSAIVCGGVLAVVLAARGLQIDGTRIAGKGEAVAEPPEVELAPEDGEEPGSGQDNSAPKNKQKNKPENGPEHGPENTAPKGAPENPAAADEADEADESDEDGEAAAQDVHTQEEKS